MNEFDKGYWTGFIVALLSVVVGFGTSVLLSGCATINDAPTKLEDCDEFIVRRVEGHARLRTLPIGSGTAVTKDGIILWIQLFNAHSRKIHLEVLVDTDRAEKAAAAEGLKRVGVCDRGGRTWYALSGVAGDVTSKETAKGI